MSPGSGRNVLVVTRGGPSQHDGDTHVLSADQVYGFLRYEHPIAYYRRSDPVQIAETTQGPAEIWVYVGDGANEKLASGEERSQVTE